MSHVHAEYSHHEATGFRCVCGARRVRPGVWEEAVAPCEVCAAPSHPATPRRCQWHAPTVDDEMTDEERAAEDAYWTALAERKRAEADAADHAADMRHDAWRDEA